jgi:hypothetical protein
MSYYLYTIVILSHTVTHMPVARQLVGKHIPEVTLSTIGYPLLGNGRIDTYSRTTEDDVFRGVHVEEL